MSVDSGNGDSSSGGSGNGVELVVLLDEDGRAIGTADKAAVHTADTALHLAFSSYVFNRRGEVLLTQRASSKKTWPGVWTNTCCGHPSPGEELDGAVVRRLGQELGLTVQSAQIVLPRFRYRAVMDNGIVEYEVCPVFRVVTDADEGTDSSDGLRPDPAEVDAVSWRPWREFAAGVLAGTEDVSPWCVEQVQQLSALGDDPLTWPVAPASELPPAATVSGGA